MKKPIAFVTWIFASTAVPLQADVPTVPAELHVAPLGRTSHVLRWSDTTNETGYAIERWNGSSWDGVTTVGGNVTSYIDPGQADGALPEYRVSAFNAEGSSGPSGGVASLRMNVLFFYADDMGFKDVVANRNEVTDGPTIFETPSLDTLLSQGVNFTQAYASGPKCVVARRAMQTGMYDFRTAAIAKGGGIGNEMITMGEAMQAGGYRTCFIGKWHLGGSLASELQPHGVPDYDLNPSLDPLDPNYDEANKVPSAQGYDVSIAAGEYGAPPISYFASTATDVADEYWYGLPDLYSSDPAEYLTDRLTSEATGFVSDHLSSHGSDPFFLMLAHYAVHTPLEAKQADIDYFEAKKTAMADDFASHPAGSPEQVDYTSKVRNFQDQTTYAAMVKSFDDSLATIRAYLAVTSDPRNPGKMLSDTTIIVYSSDHGGKSTHWINSNNSNDIPTSNYPLRQGKTWCYEGGLKVPLVVYWPGVSEAGTTSDTLINGADFYTTFLDMTGTPRQPTQHLDSISFARTAVEPSVSARDESFHWFTNADVGTGNPALAVYRSGPYKLVYQIIRRIPELYNLEEDISEVNDIVSIRPDLADEMLRRLIEKRNETGAKPSKPGSNSWNNEIQVIAPVVTIPSLPDGPPSGLTGSEVSSTAIDLQWTDGSSNEERFVIERKIQGSGGFIEFTTVPANVVRFRDTDLAPGTSYQYRIQAETLAGWNGPSNQITVATPSVSAELPIIVRGDAVSVLKNETRRFEPLLNDQGEGLVIAGVSAATLGTASVDGSYIVFIPQHGVIGSEQISYTVTDSHGASATGIVELTILNDLSVAAPPVFDQSPTKELVDAWEFNEATPTQIKNCVNFASGATSDFASGTTPETDGSALAFAQGGSSNAIYRVTTTCSPGGKTLGAADAGIYEMSVRFTAADLSGGSTNGSYAGASMRDATAGVDVCAFRLQERSGNLELQFRNPSINTIVGFTGSVLSEVLEARAEVDLVSRIATVYYTLGSADEEKAGSYPVDPAASVWDIYRISSFNKDIDWGAGDFIKLDYFRINSVVYPPSPTPYDYWMSEEGASAAPGDLLPAADPDGDQLINVGEFAFGGDPFDGSSAVVQRISVGDTAADVDTLDELVVTLPVRSGSQFYQTGSGPVSATVDGLVYQVMGSLDLIDFTEPVDEVFPALESGYPPVAPGWEYHSFRIPGSNGVAGRGFIQSVVETTP